MFLRSMRPDTILLPLALAAVGCAGAPQKSAPPPQTKAAAPKHRRTDQRQIAYQVLDEVRRGVRSASETYSYARSIIRTPEDAQEWMDVFCGAGSVRGAAVEQIEFACWLVDHGADSQQMPRWARWDSSQPNTRLLWDVLREQYCVWVEELGMLGTWRKLYPDMVTVEELCESSSPSGHSWVRFCVRLR